ARVGKIVQVKGPVIEARFDPEDLPGILDALTITDEPRKIDVTVEVAQRLGNGVVRCIAAAPVKGLKRGMKVVRTQEPVRMSVEAKGLERAGKTRAGGPAAGGEAPEILEMGIKVIDLLCPYVKGGKIGIFGLAGIGKLVVVEEIVRRIASREKGVSLF